MNLFSQRKGIKPIRTTFQVESMDNDLRIRIWNIFYAGYWEYGHSTREQNQIFDSYVRGLWHIHLKWPIDMIGNPDIYKTLKESILENEWNEVLDFLEFTVNSYPNEEVNQG